MKNIIVIGGGPGGYVAAIRAAQLGAQVTVIEKQYLGGTCLNVGCIPTKCLLHSAELVSQIKEQGKDIGVEVEGVHVNFPQVIAHKNAVSKQLTSGIAGLLKLNKVKKIDGEASFIAPKKLSVKKADGTTDKNADGTYNVIVKITDTESVGNAKYVLRYDPAKMTYVSSTSRNYSAIHVDETKGEITLAFANPVEVAAGTAIGTVKFLAEKNVETTVTVTTEERNANTNVNEAPATVKVDTTETPEVDKPIVIIPTKPGGTPADKKLPFTDVSKYDEFYDAVKYLYERDIMNGTSDTLFSPNAELTRGMVVTILYRMEGEPFTTGSKTFSDVAAGRYYSKAVEWAAENDIVNGFKDGTFKPNDPVTREQLAAIISRYAEFNGIVIYEPNNALASTDVVSNWAKKNVAWAAAEGILTPAQTANATKNATRAEVAMAIYTYLTKTAK